MLERPVQPPIIFGCLRLLMRLQFRRGALPSLTSLASAECRHGLPSDAFFEDRERQSFSSDFQVAV